MERFIRQPDSLQPELPDDGDWRKVYGSGQY